MKQLETPRKESFAQLVYDKFLTFSMTDYKRVMFLDADTVPLTNLDYLFHLSDPDYMDAPTLLKLNLIFATNGEPCNTAMFIVEPSKEDSTKLQGHYHILTLMEKKDGESIFRERSSKSMIIGNHTVPMLHIGVFMLLIQTRDSCTTLCNLF